MVSALLAHGTDMAFCVPGESYLAALDALYDVQDHIRLVSCRHEGGAANMAEAYGKLTGRPGICFVTRGPGAANASIGVHTAFQDSTPMILFVGQVASDQRDREAFQEVNFEAFFGPLAKWAAEIQSADRIAEYVGRAFQTAVSGRPGPVVLALPEDMLSGPAPVQKSRHHPPVKAHPGADDLARIKKALETATRPLVILGGSGWNKEAIADIRHFLEANHLPAGAAFRCQDLIDNRHANYAGDIGIGINPKLAERVKKADLILAIGPRLGEMTTGGYTLIQSPVPPQKLVHIHAGADELGRVFQGNILVNAGPAEFAAAVRDMQIAGAEKWRSRTRQARAEYEDWITPRPHPGPVQLPEIYAYMREHLPEDSIFTNGAGNYTAWLHRYYQYRSFKTQLAPTSGAMGYGVPAAIAAKITHPDRTVICAAGDGCFMMTAQELATAVQYQANVIFLVFNNSMYGTIRMHQEKHYPGRVVGTDLVNPDFVAYAVAFGAYGEKIASTDDFPGALRRAMEAGKPALIEIPVLPDAISTQTTLSDLKPRK